MDFHAAAPTESDTYSYDAWGNILATGGSGLCILGYAGEMAPILGVTGKQAVAYGLLSYDAFAIFIAPFLGLDTEVLEYPS